jgi:hypothetical protein
MSILIVITEIDIIWRRIVLIFLLDEIFCWIRHLAAVLASSAVVTVRSPT